MSQDVKQLRVKIFDELSKIVDPEINTTITELELVDEVDISEDSVKVDLHLTSPFCPAVFGFKICQDIHDNLLGIDGIENVKVNVSNHFMAEQITTQVSHQLSLICYLFPYLAYLQCIYKLVPKPEDQQMMCP